MSLDKIYGLVFKNPAPIDFVNRSGFPRSAAFLRVNKVVYNEARAFVYGENRFIFGYNFAKYGEYFGMYILGPSLPLAWRSELYRLPNVVWEKRDPIHPRPVFRLPRLFRISNAE